MTAGAPKPEKCARCGITFECRSFDIASCHCSKNHISPAQLKALEARYPGCLCAGCLQDEIRKTPKKLNATQ